MIELTLISHQKVLFFYFFISKFLSLVSFFRVRLSVTVRVGVNSSSNPNPKFQSFLGNLILEYPV